MVQIVQKDVIWKALAFTIIIFAIGVYMGYYFETGRFVKVEKDFNSLEVDWTDAQLRSDYFKVFEPTEDFCDSAITENLEFNEALYKQGRELQQFEDTSRLTEAYLLDKKKYTLLKLQFWLNSINLKERCDADYVHVVYLYAQDPTDKQRTYQAVLSEVLEDIKNKFGSKIILIPLAADLNIGTVDAVMDRFNVNKLPAIIIGEDEVLEGLHSKGDIEDTINNAK